MTRTSSCAKATLHPTAWGRCGASPSAPAAASEEVVAWEPPRHLGYVAVRGLPCATTGPTCTSTERADRHRRDVALQRGAAHPRHRCRCSTLDCGAWCAASPAGCAVRGPARTQQDLTRRRPVDRPRCPVRACPRRRAAPPRRDRARARRSTRSPTQQHAREGTVAPAADHEKLGAPGGLGQHEGGVALGHLQVHRPRRGRRRARRRPSRCSAFGHPRRGRSPTDRAAPIRASAGTPTSSPR